MKNAMVFCFTVFIMVPMTLSAASKEFTAVSPFDLARYLGTWYELVRMPASFENGLTNVTATYSLKNNGMVKVENAGMKNGKKKTAIGKAKFAHDTNTGYLRVSFFGPFYADYKVIVLDSAYRYAMVASSLKYLWILCREPKLDDAILHDLVDKAKNLGYDVAKLYYTPQ
ncbi:MAG TPA: lipocalin family protein [Chitinivibrionales bacterium]